MITNQSHHFNKLVMRKRQCQVNSQPVGNTALCFNQYVKGEPNLLQ